MPRRLIHTVTRIHSHRRSTVSVRRVLQDLLVHRDNRDRRAIPERKDLRVMPERRALEETRATPECLDCLVLRVHLDIPGVRTRRIPILLLLLLLPRHLGMEAMEEALENKIGTTIGSMMRKTVITAMSGPSVL